MPDIPLKYLQVEPKEDSPSKLASVAGKLTKWFLFATEFEVLRAFVNKLRDDIDTSKGFGVKMKRFETTFTGSQIITLPSNYVDVYMIDVQGQGALSSSQYTLIAPNQIEILDELDTNDYIVVMYSEPLGDNENYYTKTQTNNLLDLKVDKAPGERLITFSEAEKLLNLSGTNTGDHAVNLTSQAYTDSKITQLVDGATVGANTLKKLEDKILAINAIIGGTAPDGDSIVNTVSELLQVFETYPEGTDIASLLAAKINASDIINNLDQLVVGKVLDATQGKVLKELIDDLTLVVDNKIDKQAQTVFVQSLADLPTPSAGTITMSSSKTYVFTGAVDLMGNRILATQPVKLCGLGSTVSKLTSTGLSTSEYLISSVNDLEISGLTLESHRVVTRSSGAPATNYFYMDKCTVLNSPQMGVINNTGVISVTNCSFVNSDKLQFTGTSNSIVLEGCSMSSTVSGLGIIDASAITVNKRFRICYCNIENNAPSDALQIGLANIPNEGLLIDTCRFTGAAVYPFHASNKALIVNSTGITNTSTVGFMSMVDNATATVQTSPTWTKALGTTTAGAANSKFTHTDNRLTYTGAFTTNFIVDVRANMFCANNAQVVSVGIAKNGIMVSTQEMTARYIDGSNPVAASCLVPIQLTANDYIEVFIRNATSNSNVTVQDMQCLITKIPV